MSDLNIWATELADYLTEHLHSDNQTLHAYTHLSQKAKDERVCYLLNLILDDAVRHNRLFHEMVNWLRAESEPRDVPGIRLPGTGGYPQESHEVAGQVKALLEDEARHARELRRFKRQVDDVEDTKWWTILIEMVELDTKKHIRVLEEIRDYLADTVPRQRS
jgi:hypothetical protein